MAGLYHGCLLSWLACIMAGLYRGWLVSWLACIVAGLYNGWLVCLKYSLSTLLVMIYTHKCWDGAWYMTETESKPAHHSPGLVI